MQKVRINSDNHSIRKVFQSSVCLMLTMLFGFAQMFGWSGTANGSGGEIYRSEKQYLIPGESSSHPGGTMVIQLFKDLADSDKPAENEEDNLLPREFWNPAEIQKASADHVRWFQQNRILNNRKIPSLFILFQSWKGLL